MYTLMRNCGIRSGLLVELPALIVSLLAAELFFKFHSFTLECLAFLTTWAVISVPIGAAISVIAPERKPSN